MYRALIIDSGDIFNWIESEYGIHWNECNAIFFTSNYWEHNNYTSVSIDTVTALEEENFSPDWLEYKYLEAHNLLKENLILIDGN